MQIKLKSLRLKNFKGIKNLQVDFGQVTNILGENASGKTTIFDAFTWLLFDKDSTDRKDFTIKTLDINGDIIHGLEHEVEGTVDFDGKGITFKKTYKEKWTKKRGEATRQLTGHTTDYYIDDVPVKKSEYQDKINSLIDENIFKLVTNPLYFNTILGWKDRRKILLEVVGDFSDDDVIAGNKNLEKLQDLLRDKDIETFKKSIVARKKKLNEELKMIPVRIDELNNTIVGTENIDQEALEFQIRAIAGSIKDVENQIMDHSKIYEKNSQIKAEIYKKKDRLREIQEEEKTKAQEPRKLLQEEIFKAESKLNEYERMLQVYKQNINSNNDEIATLERNILDLRNKWFERNKEQFIFDDKQCICPTCRQELPPEDIENKKSEMENNFNSRKKSDLGSITRKGKELSDKIQGLKSENEKFQNEIQDLEVKSQELEELIQSKKQELEKIAIGDIKLPGEYREIEKEIEELEKSIVEPDEKVINELKVKKENMTKEIDELKDQIRAQEQNTKAKKRIVELEERERELSNQIAELEGQEYLCEEFVRTKVDMLESRINSKFKKVSFKLFDTLVNGALEETCETLIDGVPFQDANNAAKINAGIDIINTLSNHYGINAPIFIDNRESINELIESNSQIVNLIVSKDKKLNVEVA